MTVVLFVRKPLKKKSFFETISTAGFFTTCITAYPSTKGPFMPSFIFKFFFRAKSEPQKNVFQPPFTAGTHKQIALYTLFIFLLSMVKR